VSKRKDKSTKTDPVNETATKVIATVVKTARPPEATDVPTAVNPEYAVAIENVKTAVANYGRSAWQLAWALIDFKTAHEKLHPTEHLTDKQLAQVLAVNLSHQRIGQLVNTAKAFPRDQVDESIDFRVYERARTQHKLMTPEKRLALVKEHPTTAAIGKLHTEDRRQNTAAHQELKIQVTPARVENEPPKVEARLNRALVTLPADLIDAIQKYAAPLLDKTGEAGKTAAE
jgi:hypothetical protein